MDKLTVTQAMTDEQRKLADELRERLSSSVGYDGLGRWLSRNGDRIDTALRATPGRDDVLEEAAIKLTPAEIQSGHDRVRWAEGLITQLPDTHDGRNSWLLNYGVGEEAKKRRAAWLAGNPGRGMSSFPAIRALTPDTGETK